MTPQNVKAPASADARALRNVDQLGRLISSKGRRSRLANQPRAVRFWRHDGNADAITLAPAGGVATQARRRRANFARDITAQAFAERRGGKLSLSALRYGRRM